MRSLGIDNKLFKTPIKNKTKKGQTFSIIQNNRSRFEEIGRLNKQMELT